MTAPTAPVDIGTLIESRPGVCGGSPVLKGTRMPVKALAARYQMGMSAEEIREQFPHLAAEKVYAGLAYYFANKAPVEADLEEDRIAEEEWAAEVDAKKRAAKVS